MPSALLLRTRHSERWPIARIVIMSWASVNGNSQPIGLPHRSTAVLNSHQKILSVLLNFSYKALDKVAENRAEPHVVCPELPPNYSQREF